MIESQKVSEILKQNLQNSFHSFRLDLLPGDASNRRYYRLYLDNGEGSTLIMMELSDPENFKASEEKISGQASPVKELPFINIQKFLAKKNVGVPKIFHYEIPDGLLFLEDLGDLTLAQVIQGASVTETEAFYRSAIDELIRLQAGGNENGKEACIAFGRFFDIPLLMWEFDHFLEYGVEAGSQKRIKDSDRAKIRNYFHQISKKLSVEPQCLTHRDYHSRNLMVHQKRIRVIDFQDALIGPYVYDIASLLRDSYVSLPEPCIDSLLTYYLERRRETGWPSVAPNAFREIFDLMSVQRNLKAAGRFIYIDRVKKNPRFLPFVAPTLKNVRRNLLDTRPLRLFFISYNPLLRNSRIYESNDFGRGPGNTPSAPDGPLS